MNYEFHQITILLASIKNWKAPRVNSETPIEKASYYGRVVKALDLRSKGQVFSWVRTPVVAFFLKTAVGSEFVTESKQKTVSKWLRQWNVSMNYDFHQITILLASIKNWKAPRVSSETPIEKTSYYGRVVKALDLRSNGQVSSWFRTPVVAFFLKFAVGSEFVQESKQMTVSKWLRQWNVSMNYDFHQITILLASIKNWKAPRVSSETPIEKTSYYGRVVKALDLRSNGQMSSWVRTPVVAFFLKFAVGSEFVQESKQMTVSKWLRQWNVSMNYDFHQITILLASIKNWKAPRVSSETPIEKTSYYGRVVKALDLRSNGQVSSWVRTPVVAFFLKTAVGSEFVTESKQMTVSKWLKQWNVSMNYDFHQITILLASIKNWKAPRVSSETPIEKTSYYGRVVKALDLRSNGQVSSWVRTPVVAFFLKFAVGSEFVQESKQMTVSKWLRQWNVSMNYEFHQITILLASIKNWKAPRVNSETPIEKASYYGRVVKALDLRSNGQVSSWVRTPVVAFIWKLLWGVSLSQKANKWQFRND